MTDPSTPAPSRRQFLRAAAVATPVGVAGTAVLSSGGSAVAQPAGRRQVVHDFRHRGHRVVVTRSSTGLDLEVDGHCVRGAIVVRADGVLASPDYLPYSDADWGSDVQALARRLVDGNGSDYVLF